MERTLMDSETLNDQIMDSAIWSYMDHIIFRVFFTYKIDF